MLLDQITRELIAHCHNINKAAELGGDLVVIPWSDYKGFWQKLRDFDAAYKAQCVEPANDK